MSDDNLYKYTEVGSYIWHIAEDRNVYCTLIRGSEMALLIDTGYGHRNLREFVEKNITTPYMVINSHGHPDHIGGNHWFDTVWAVKEEWDVIEHFEEEKRDYERKEVQIGEEISLGDIHVEIISLPGHTKGSVGFLIQEEGILVAGDALNEGLLLFNYGALTMKQLYDTLKRIMSLDFTLYICGHSDGVYQKEKISTHIKNIENLKVDESTIRNMMGFQAYCSSYQDDNGKSEIMFTRDRLS